MGNYYDILIVRRLLGIINDEEEERLEEWRRKDAANEALFQQMIHEGSFNVAPAEKAENCYIQQNVTQTAYILPEPSQKRGGSNEQRHNDKRS